MRFYLSSFIEFKLFRLAKNGRKTLHLVAKTQGPVVQKVNIAIHWIVIFSSFLNMLSNG